MEHKLSNPDEQPAPALARGIATLKLLIAEGPATLESCSARLGYPKSSLKRLLDTLVSSGLVIRDGESREYRALFALTSADSLEERGRALIDDTLKSLGSDLKETTEWYVWDGSHFIITQRWEPADKEVSVRARIGYKRNHETELEAVARCAYALGLAPPDQALSTKVWRSGISTPLPTVVINRMIDDCRLHRGAYDEDCNSNGIRRYAALVSEEHESASLLAVAESWSVRDKSEREKRFKTVLEAASRLSHQLIDL